MQQPSTQGSARRHQPSGGALEHPFITVKGKIDSAGSFCGPKYAPDSILRALAPKVSPTTVRLTPAASGAKFSNIEERERERER